VVCAALAGVAGCAGAPPPPARDLVEAQGELGHVWASPQAELAPGEMAEAEAALAEAERGAGAGWDAADDAYVARRMAERAHLAVLYAAEREALFRARGAVRRLRDDVRRRRAFFEDLARRRRAEAEARARVAAARRAALERARGPGAEILARPEGLLFRLASEPIFLPGTSLLRDGAEARLDALAAALRAGPACDVRVQVLDDADGFRAEPDRLASRRAKRVRDTLRAGGVPGDAFVAPLRQAPCGTQIDVLVIERPVVLPQEAPAGGP
jgi:outer membrane protein OmpA-like peptidoglycan-associated protein